jgi:hypothetical protein
VDLEIWLRIQAAIKRQVSCHPVALSGKVHNNSADPPELQGCALTKIHVESKVISKAKKSPTNSNRQEFAGASPARPNESPSKSSKRVNQAAALTKAAIPEFALIWAI